MIRWPSGILAATTPIDLRLSFDRLAAIVREQLGADPRRETLVVFHNRARTHVKLLWHDGSGYCLLYKKLARGRFHLACDLAAGATHVEVESAELSLMLEGFDLSDAVRRKRWRPQKGTREAAVPSVPGSLPSPYAAATARVG
jgi:transposase